ncbi:cytochrome P450 [Paraphoma chrysanthemicola]|uniref:Cytochrome P450 n=1 Tax=Paraphoma chrysanthemicola TaxID=798071 RepID=A0A8K0R8R3_9PLEO|nr:cytochrome P450 [Paraphoma chrysanthemicola]
MLQLLSLSASDFIRGVGLLGVCFISYWVIPFLHGLIVSPTRDVPGPLLARITRWYEFFAVLRGDSNVEYMKLHNRFGHVVRMGPNRYSFSDPRDVRIIYELGGKFIKSEFYHPLLAPKPDDQNIFAIRDPAVHKARRRKIANLYSMSTMVSYEGAVDRMNKICMGKLTALASKGRKFSLPNFLQWYAFDVIGEITFNESFRMMENEGDVTGMIDGIHKANNYLAHTGIIPDFHPWIMRLQSLLGSKGALVFLKYTLDQIDKHRVSNSKGTDGVSSDSFLAKLIALQKEDKVSMPHILDACGSNIGAGSDTTAISLSASIYYIYHHRNVLAKLRDEIDMMAHKGLISDPITFQEAQSMPYLQAVIKESLRVHPAVGTILPRKVPKGGVKLAGTFFPEGTDVGANAWVLHYSKDIYGDDAADYKPERWLEAKADNDSRDSMMLAFGAGSRSCIGKNISLLEITKLLPQIVRKLDFIFDHTGPQTYCAWFVYMKYNVQVKVRTTS